MIQVKIRTSTKTELEQVAQLLKTIGVEQQRGAIKSDGFTFYGKFTTQNDD